MTDPDRCPIGKFIVIQESLKYLVEGQGSLILERPLSGDFLAGTPVRPLSDVDQHWTESSSSVPTIKMIRLDTSEESEEEPEPEQSGQATEPPPDRPRLREIIQTQRDQLIWVNLHINFLNPGLLIECVDT